MATSDLDTAPATPGARAGRRDTLLRKLRRVGQVLASLAILGVLLLLVLPEVAGASWEAALVAISSVSPAQLVGLTALWLLGLWAYSFVLAASLPGLTKGQGFVLNLVGSGVSNLVPFGGALGVGAMWGMARQYGFSHRAIGLFTAVTGVWNVLARLALPVAGLVGLAMVGARVDGPLMIVAAVGAGLCAVVIGLLTTALVSDRAARPLLAGLTTVAGALARLLRRPTPQDMEAELADLRESAVALLRAGRGGLVGGMLAYLVLQGVLMWACLAAVGSDLGVAEVTAGYACGRLLTIVVLTPGGTGFAETGTAAVLVALGGDPAVTLAGVLLFSFFTFVCEIPGGALAYGWHVVACRRARSARAGEAGAG